MIEIRQVTEPEQALIPPLCELLIDTVHNGASVGFLAPLSIDRAGKHLKLTPSAFVSHPNTRNGKGYSIILMTLFLRWNISSQWWET